MLTEWSQRVREQAIQTHSNVSNAAYNRWYDLNALRKSVQWEGVWNAKNWDFLISSLCNEPIKWYLGALLTTFPAPLAWRSSVPYSLKTTNAEREERAKVPFRWFWEVSISPTATYCFWCRSIHFESRQVPFKNWIWRKSSLADWYANSRLSNISWYVRLCRVWYTAESLFSFDMTTQHSVDRLQFFSPVKLAVSLSLKYAVQTRDMQKNRLCNKHSLKALT